MNIDCEKSVNTLYGDLLSQRRQIEREVQSGKATCKHCQASNAVHLPDMRCTSWCGSEFFLNSRQGEWEQISKALTALEVLIDMV